MARLIDRCGIGPRHDEVHCGGLAVAKFSITDAKTRFSELIQKAIAGEEVIIAKDNKPVVKIVPIVTPGRKRVPGSAKGQIWMAADFDATPEDFKNYS
jgi:prevent-host-death family protein